MKLSQRKHFILCSVVEDYIKDAMPITSGGVRDKHIKEISTATLRNELNALESMGYLKQLHTSGGRIPTPDGYRYYVTKLLEDFKVSEPELEKVKNSIDTQTNTLSQILEQLTEIVSRATKYPTVMIANGYDKLVIEEIKIIPLIGSELLVLFKTESGIVKNSLNANASEKICNDASVFLTKRFAGKTIGEMIEGDDLSKSLSEVQAFKSLFDSLVESMRRFITTKNVDIRSESAVSILNVNEQNSIKQTKNILSLLSDKDKLATAVESSGDDITVTIGEENDTMAGCALISAPITINGATVGSIAVIGPDRMNYATIAGALKIVMNELKDIK